MAQRITNRRAVVAVIDDNSSTLHTLEPNASAIADFTHAQAAEHPGIEFQDTDEKPRRDNPAEVFQFAEIISYRPTVTVIDLGGQSIELAPKGDPDGRDRRVVRNVNPVTTRLPGIVTKELSKKQFDKSPSSRAAERREEVEEETARFFETPEELFEWGMGVPWETLRAFARKRKIRGRSREQLIGRLQTALFGV